MNSIFTKMQIIISFCCLATSIVLSQSDTLTTIYEFDSPIPKPHGLTYDGTHFWLYEHGNGLIYKIDTNGECLDTLDGPNTRNIEVIGNNLWIRSYQSDWLMKLDKTTGQVLDSIMIEMPNVFSGTDGCRDFCSWDSSIYSVWAYCWCGVHRFLKTDLTTKETTDFGDIPAYDNLVVINDTIWLGNSNIVPFLTNDSMITSNRNLYLGNFYITGIAFDGNNLWVIDYDNKRIKKLSKITSTHFQDKFKLYQNFPNPFYISTVIKYNLKKPGIVNMDIYNLSGQKIQTLINEYQIAGEHQLRWIAKGLPSGIYFYKLHVGEFSETRKLILQK